jgi:hypothetical protein
MTETSSTELNLLQAVLAPSPGYAPSARPDPPLAGVALKRCCAAWRRAYKAYMEMEDSDQNSVLDRRFASEQAAAAYRGAMPSLATCDSIRDFIDCAAHGVLMGAISPRQCSQLLCAARVALGVLHDEPKPQKSAAK